MLQDRSHKYKPPSIICAQFALVTLINYEKLGWHGSYIANDNNAHKVTIFFSKLDDGTSLISNIDNENIISYIMTLIV